MQQVLKFDPASAVTGKKRKRVRKLQSSFRTAAQRAQTKLIKVAPKALAFIDRKGGGAGASLFPPGPALASAGCSPGPAGPSGGFEGASMGALGDNGGFMEVPIGGGLKARVTFVSCGGVTAFNIPECPTANGTVDGRGRGEFSVTFEIRSSSQVISRSTTNFEQKAKIHGVVGPDAKLKSLDVEHTEEVFIVATTQGYPIVIRGGVTRKIHIPMPSGQYDPAGASARFFGDPLDPKSGAESFADTAKSAIDSYKKAEERWSSFKEPYCAEPIFDPASDAIKLKRGDSKQLGIYAKARADGGRATDPLDPARRRSTPSSRRWLRRTPSPTIQYTVAKAPAGDQVRVTAKVTSTAGVGQKTWTQPISPAGRNHIVGTFDGEFKGPPSVEGRTVQIWSGTVEFNRLGTIEGADYYTLIAGEVTITASGLDGSGISGCQQQGSNSNRKLPGGSLEITPLGEGGGAPYEYTIAVDMPFEAIDITRVDCNEASQKEGFENTHYPLTPAYRLDPSGQTSSDGIDFTGTKDEGFGEFVYVQHWNLHGTE